MKQIPVIRHLGACPRGVPWVLGARLLLLLLIESRPAQAIILLLHGYIVVDSFVVVIDGHGERSLGHVLTNDVLVQVFVDFLGVGRGLPHWSTRARGMFGCKSLLIESVGEKIYILVGRDPGVSLKGRIFRLPEQPCWLFA